MSELTGIGRDALIRALEEKEKECQQLRSLLLLTEQRANMWLNNLTSTQARCTELLDQYRALKRGDK